MRDAGKAGFKDAGSFNSEYLTFFLIGPFTRRQVPFHQNCKQIIGRYAFCRIMDCQIWTSLCLDFWRENNGFGTITAFNHIKKSM